MSQIFTFEYVNKLFCLIQFTSTSPWTFFANFVVIIKVGTITAISHKSATRGCDVQLIESITASAIEIFSCSHFGANGILKHIENLHHRNVKMYYVISYLNTMIIHLNINYLNPYWMSFWMQLFLSQTLQKNFKTWQLCQSRIYPWKRNEIGNSFV